jgi:multiple sugar transport system substrate-binding protein
LFLKEEKKMSTIRTERLFVLIGLAATLLVLAACAPAPTPTPVPTVAPPTKVPEPTKLPEPTKTPEPTKPLATVAPTATPAPITLSIICRCVAGGVNANTVKWLTEYVIPKYQEGLKKQGKNVTVNLVQFGGSDEELKARYALDLKAGAGNDVMAFDGFWVPEFVEGGLIKPLDVVASAKVNEWEGWSHIPKTVQELLVYQGKRYGIPVGTDARAIWYRKDILKAAGLPDNWQPKSWDELLDAARAVKKAKPDVSPLQINAGTSMGEATTLQGWYMVVLGAGANVYNFETSKYIVKGQPLLDALNLYKRIYIDEQLGDARLQLLKDGRDRSFLAFRDGKIAMLVEGDWFWRSVLATGSTKLENREQLVGWAKMPAMAPGKGIRKQDFVTASGGTGYALGPNTKNPAEAWALLSFMFSKESLDYIQAFEPRIRARDDVPVPNEPVMTALAKELLPFTMIRPPDAAYSKVVSPEIQLMTERLVSGEMTPQQAVDAYAKAVTAAVGANRVEEVK